MKSVTRSVVIGALVVLWAGTLNLALSFVSADNDVKVGFGIALLLFLIPVGIAALFAQLKRLAGPLFLMLLSVAVSGCGTTVNPGYVGIQVNYYGQDKGVQSYPVVTGRVWYNPWTTSVFEYPTFVQTAKWTKSVTEGNPINEEITFTSVDGMSIAADISLSYHLLREKVPSFYVKFRSDDLSQFTHGFLRNLARDKFDSHGGRFRIDQIMGDNAVFVRDVRADLQGDLNDIGVQIDQLGFIGAPRPPAQVIEAINAKVHANQLALQKQNELVQVQADAQKEVAKAEGYAKALTVKGEAEAAYNLKVAASMSDRLVAKWQLDKWNGVLPNVTSGAVPFINVK